MKEETIFSRLEKCKGIEITAVTDGILWGYRFSITSNKTGIGYPSSDISFETKDKAIVKACVSVKDKLKKFDNVFGAKDFYKFYEEKTQLSIFK